VRNPWTREDGDAPDLLVGGRVSAAKRIILIGHGPGVVGISELLEARSKHFFALGHVHSLRCSAAGVMRHVKLVVQVVGHSRIPLVPKKGPDLITWYQKVRRYTFHIFIMPASNVKLAFARYCPARSCHSL
jgi:hypothetical protein